MKVHRIGYITALTFILIWATRNALGEVVLSAAILAYDHDAASLESGTRNSASPRLATSISEVY
jgi:hypothetical protein